jgi:hypothetical protein
MNWSRILLIMISLIVIILSITGLFDGDFSVPNVGGLLFGLLFFFLSVYQKRIDKWSKRSIQQQKEDLACRFTAGGILFPRGYYFRHGYLKNKNLLPYTVIEELRLNTFPPCAKIEGNELIYFHGKGKEELEQLAQEKGIPVRAPQDNWSLICEEYLDTELQEDEKLTINAKLTGVGITEEELGKIRSKIGWRMSLFTYLSWEWVYYGHYDVLTQLKPMSAKTYWWTMEIALRE